MNFRGLSDALLPWLLEQRVQFKMARSEKVLRRLNNGQSSPAAVGKAVTIYPEPTRVQDLGRELAKRLEGHVGPRILSDRRVSLQAPVYYRYGPFRTQWHAGPQGTLVVRLQGPDGEAFDAAATLSYAQPSWAVDPFCPQDTHDKTSNPPTTLQSTLLGGRYEVLEGLYESARGNVYRAVDVKSEERSKVIVKMARAYVAEDRHGTDSRSRLRNERRILEACADIAGIPSFIDHFSHGEDEYLATTDAGPNNLLDHIWQNGAMLPQRVDPSDRDGQFALFASSLITTLSELHSRGVIMRDITPRNVVLDQGRVTIIDFGISSFNGLMLPGGTPGYAPQGQLDGSEEADVKDDYFALGMLLSFASTGLPPVVGGASKELARTRMVQSLHAIYGSRRSGFVMAIDDLLSGDASKASRALQVFACRSWVSAVDHFVAPPTVTDPGKLLQQKVLNLLLDDGSKYHISGGERNDFAAVDASLYTGSAGIGFELLHHLDHPGARQVLGQLVGHGRNSVEAVALPPGLFSGRTGTEVFLHVAKTVGIEPQSPAKALRADRDPDDPNDYDVIAGHAGVGLAHLLIGDLEHAHALGESLVARPELAIMPTDAVASLGRSTNFGYAHGFVGLTDFLVLLAARSNDKKVGDAAFKRASALVDLVPSLASAAGAPSASPMAASWCRGVTGLVRPLRHAWHTFGDDKFLQAAETAALASAAWISRMGTAGQCCGTAGIGSMLLDMASDTREERYWEAAHEAARHLMRRSHGPDDDPRLVANNDFREAPYSWAQGYAGILTFLRRLNRPHTPDLLPSP
ncbi:protein kinase [Streptomyces sp. ME01-18a]|uniref:class III lanthionine synthetase LanKC N-terminal domain-containing protein n=1 Tax=Streptomyces sp. ME01-18a TaxID=3028669 RepID=UPI0029B391E5|nr:lanthionine synthetase LanC family protein [Streptomyces sp. ME01-18a]MDX3433920.1 protein kinase [Streptomyces sp. ME01-18a]